MKSGVGEFRSEKITDSSRLIINHVPATNQPG